MSAKEICPICYIKEVNITTICRHQFCNECIEKWKAILSTCPYCRSSLLPEITLRNIYYPSWVGTGKVIKEGKSPADVPYYQLEIHTYSTLQVKYQHFFFMNQWEVIL